MSKTIIDPSEDWCIRVAEQGRQIEDGPPYLLSGEYEPLIVHQSDILTDVWYRRSGATGYNALGPGPTGDSITVPFPELGYKPIVFFAVTSDAIGGDILFPSGNDNYVPPGYLGYHPVNCPVNMEVTTNSLIFYANTYLYYYNTGGAGATTYEDCSHPNRQGDIYYTVFKNAEAV